MKLCMIKFWNSSIFTERSVLVKRYGQFLKKTQLLLLFLEKMCSNFRSCFIYFWFNRIVTFIRRTFENPMRRVNFWSRLATELLRDHRSYVWIGQNEIYSDTTWKVSHRLFPFSLWSIYLNVNDKKTSLIVSQLITGHRSIDLKMMYTID